MDLQRDKHPQYREPDQSTSENRTDPMDRRIRSPSEPKHGYDKCPSGYYTELQSLFRLWRLWCQFMSVFEVSRFDYGDESTLLITYWGERGDVQEDT